MLEETVIPINFGQGVDSKSDPKAVPAGKMLRLENAVFSKPNQITKRNGYTALSTTVAGGAAISAPKLIHDYKNELIALDNNRILSYSPNETAWHDKGRYTSVEVSRSLVSEDLDSSGLADVAILGNYALYGYSNATGDIYGQVVDLISGDILVNSLVASSFVAATQPVKCVLLGGTTLAIVYQKSTLQYGARTVTFSGGGVVSFSAETIITTTATGPLDIIPTATGGAFVYPQSTTPGITVSTLSTALAVSSANIAAVLGNVNATVVAIQKTSSGNIWVYWNETTDDGFGNLTASSIYYAVFSSTLVPVLARTLLVALGTPYYISNMTARATSATAQTLYFGLFASLGPAPANEAETTNYITATDAGAVGASTLFAHGVTPFSHTFDIGSRQYAIFLYRMADMTLTIGGTVGPSIQPTFFLIELTNLVTVPYVAARFASGVAASYSGLLQTRISTQNVAAFSITKVYFAPGIEVQELAGSTTYVSGTIGVYSYSFDFDSANANVAKNSGDIAVLNGGVMQMYDGASCVEWGFHLFPEIVSLTQASPFGAIAAGTYDYMAIYEWIDNQGNLHQSAPSEVQRIVVAATPSQVTIVVTSNYLTQKANSRVALYRTIGAGGATGSVFYRLGSAIATPTGLTPFSAVFVDTIADATIQTKNQAYTYPASPVLENTAPPPSMAMLPHNNRLWFVDSENPNTDVWYTKSFQPGVGLSPSGFMLEQFDPKFGKINALAEMDEKLVALKAQGVCIQAGDGVNDAGTGSTLSFPQFVPSDVGCDQLKSVITFPGGVMFHTPKGIYMLNRATNISYIGAEVEAYNAQQITSAHLLNGKSQIRFLCSTGLTIVYDYIFQQWSTFTNHTGLSSSTWNSLYVYSTGSLVFIEAPGVYTDNGVAFSVLAQTAWLGLGGIQGFQRVKRFIMLGDYANGLSASHAISVAAAYDFSTTFQAAIPYVFGSASTSGVFQYRERLPIQKCDTISLLIQETTTGSALENLDLTNMSFEAGVKRGVRKLGGLQSVG